MCQHVASLSTTLASISMLRFQIVTPFLWLSHRAERMEKGDAAGFHLIWDAVIGAAHLQLSNCTEKPDRDSSFESINIVVGQMVLELFKGKPDPKVHEAYKKAMAG